MISVEIPGYGLLQLENVVLDYNGTIAVDGIPAPGVEDILNQVAEKMNVHVVTADTFGKAKKGLEGVNCILTILGEKKQDQSKLAYVEKLGINRTVCIGNGRNDRLMLKKSALGIAVLLNECAFVPTIMDADIVSKDILFALELLLNPLRLTATLRS